MNRTFAVGIALIGFAVGGAAIAQQSNAPPLRDPALDVQRGQGSAVTGSSQLGKTPTGAADAAQRDPALEVQRGQGSAVTGSSVSGPATGTSDAAQRDPALEVQRGQGSAVTGSSVGDQPARDPNIGTGPVTGGSNPVR